MRKRGALSMLRALSLCAMLLCTIAMAYASTNAAFTLNPLEQYETTLQQYDLNVNNLGSSDVITQLTATVEQGTIVGAVSYGGWKSSINNTNNTNSTLRWYDGTVETNVVSALFQFLMRAGRVSEDTSGIITLTTQDALGFSQREDFPWTIRNDGTGPIFAVETPLDGSIILEGAPPIPLSANASDNETGVQNVTFSWRNCTNTTNATGAPSGMVTLAADGSRYSGNANFAAFTNEQRICFDYLAESNGGATSTYAGTITIDGLAPVVTLLTPADGTTMNSQTLFRFLPNDNLGAMLQCTLVVDGSDASTGSFPRQVAAEITAADAPEGSHTWMVRCADSVGLVGSSATRNYFLDRTPPTISVDRPQNAVLKEGTPITIITDDNYKLVSTLITINGNTTNSTNRTIITTNGLAEGQHDILIQATDAAGNAASLTYTYFIDKTAPVLTLFGPSEGGTTDVFASFAFTAIDQYDPIVDCIIRANGITVAAVNTTNQTQNVSASLSPGIYLWQLECVDDAENTANTEIRSLRVIDTSGPAIALTPIPQIVRGTSIPVAAEITDFSGVASASGELTDAAGTTTPVTLSVSGSTYTATIPTTIASPVGTYTLTVQAIDTNGYSSVRSIEFPVTYAYTLALFLDPQSTTPGSAVQVSGTLRSDDGALIDAYPVTLTLPAGNTSTNTSNGTFAMVFPAPSDGSYTIRASTVAPNGIEFSATAILSVATPSSDSGNGGGGGGGGGGRTGFGSSNPPPSSGSISTGEASGQGSSGGQTLAPAETPAQVAANPVDGENLNQFNAQAEPLTIAPNPFLGKAIGFFNLDALKKNRLTWSLAALALLLAVLFILGIKGHFHQTVEVEDGESSWDAYLDRLKKR